MVPAGEGGQRMDAIRYSDDRPCAVTVGRPGDGGLHYRFVTPRCGIPRRVAEGLREAVTNSKQNRGETTDPTEAGCCTNSVTVWSMGMRAMILRCPQVQIPWGLVSQLHWCGVYRANPCRRLLRSARNDTRTQGSKRQDPYYTLTVLYVNRTIR
jgi:hypothetical protein